MTIDGDQRPGITELGPRDLVDLIDGLRSSRSSFITQRADNNAAMAPVRRQIEEQIREIRAQLDPYYQRASEIDNAIRSLDHQERLATLQLRQLEQQERARREAERRFRLTTRTIGEIGNNAAALQQSNASETGSEALGSAVLKILQSESEEIRLAIPDLIEPDLSLLRNRNNGQRITVADGRDKVKLILFENGGMAVTHHPVSLEEQSSVDDILRRSGKSPTLPVDRHLIGFSPDLTTGEFKPFGLYRIKREGDVTCVPFELQMSPALDDLQAKVENILTYGLILVPTGNGKERLKIPQAPTE